MSDASIDPAVPVELLEADNERLPALFVVVTAFVAILVAAVVTLALLSSVAS